MTEFRALPAIGHVLRSTFGNLGFAFRMSWPWMVFILLLQVLVILLFPGLQKRLMSGTFTEADITIQLVTVYLVTSFASFFALSSVAVNWHRYILLDEEPEGWDRLRLDAPVMRYVGNIMLGQLIAAGVFLVGGLALIAAAVILAMILPEVAARALTGVAMVGLWLWVIIFAQRLFIKLPAAAIEREGYGFRDALADSKGHDVRLLGFVLLLLFFIVLVALAAAIPAYLVLALLGQGFAGELAGAVFQFTVNWVAVIMSVTSLTTLYGIFGEGRAV